MAILNWFQARRDAKAKALPDGYTDIVDLCALGVLMAAGTGQSITDIQAHLTSRVTVPLKVRIPHGTYFVSPGNYQNMVTRKEYEFVLAPDQTRRVSVAASCINANRPVPKDTDTFSGVARVSEALSRFLKAAEGEDAMTVQAGVWAVTDSYTRESIQSHLRVSNNPDATTTEAAVSDDQIDRAKVLLDSLGIRHYISSRPNAHSFYQRGMERFSEMGGLILSSMDDSDDDRSLAAVEDFTMAIRLKPDYAEAFYYRGIARHNLKGHRKEKKNWERGGSGVEDEVYGALQDFTEAIRLKPDYADAFYHRAIARRTTSWRNHWHYSCPFDIQGAIRDLTEALRLKPDDGDTLHELGKTHQIVERLERLAESRVDLEDKARLQGAARFAKGDVEGAVQDFTKAILLDPDDYSSFRMRGDALCAKSDLEGAVRDYTEAIRLLSKVDSQDTAHLAKDDAEAAVEFQSADLARIRSYVFYRKGDARRAKGDREGARQDFAEATRLTNYALGYYCHGRGLYFRRHGDVNKATRYLGEAVRLGYRPKNSGSR